MDSSLQSPEEIPPQTFKYKEHSKQNHQTTCLDLKGHWNQAQKPPETSRNHKSVKLNRFKPLKHQRNSTTNL